MSKQGVAGIVQTNGNSDVHVVVGGLPNPPAAGAGGAGPTAAAAAGASLLERAHRAARELGSLHLGGRVLVDCSGGAVRAGPAGAGAAAEVGGGGAAAARTSSQPAVCLAVAAAIGAGDEAICGVSLKSFLLSGRQDAAFGRAARRAGGGGEAEAEAEAAEADDEGAEAGEGGSARAREPPPVYGLSVTDPCIDWSQVRRCSRPLSPFLPVCWPLSPVHALGIPPCPRLPSSPTPPPPSASASASLPCCPL